MFLGHNQQIRDCVTRLIETHDAAEPIAIAVAFWGAGAESLLPADKHFRVICNLAMGGTNPAVIESLMARAGTEVRHLSDLHAKVILASAGALVSSANFSANGLGLEGGNGWREAGVSIAANDPEFVKVFGWFEQQWRAALPVDAPVLARARTAWSIHSAAAVAGELGESAAGLAPIVAEESPAELRESDLFQPATKPRNMLRMAADWLVDEYRVMRGGTLAKSDNFIPAYAAYALWTLAGNRMATNISAMPVFSQPDQVLQRAAERSQDNPDRVRSLISRVARSSVTPVAVRHWARQFVERNL